MLRKMAFLAVIAAVTFAFSATTFGFDVEGSTTGTFSDPSGLSSPQISNGNPVSTFKWGAVPSSKKSKLTFTGNPIGTDFVDDAADLTLGTLCYKGGLGIDCGEIDLTVNLLLTTPEGLPLQQYPVELEILTVLVGGVVHIELPSEGFEPVVFEDDTCEYTLYFDGFYDAGSDSLKTCLTAAFGCEDCAEVRGHIVRECTEPPAEIPEPATMLLLGCGLAGAAVRKLRR